MVVFIIVVISSSLTASCLLRSTLILLTMKFALMVMKIFGEVGRSAGDDGALVGLSFEDFGFAVLCWGCGVGGGRGVLGFPLFLRVLVFPLFCILFALLVRFLRCAAM